MGEKRVGVLYLVATPIGNLGDITKRAIEVLEHVDLIACEDTRRTRKLLSHLEIGKPLMAVPSHDEPRRARALVEHLVAGRSVAFASDAGMPGISDPGAALVAAAVDAGARVVPVPGVSAAVTALSVSGLPSSRFTFLGFLPRKGKERKRLLADFGSLPAALVIHEAPRRLAGTLRDLVEVLGGNRLAVVCRELTKMHEEIGRGSLEDLSVRFAEGTRGEVTLVVAPSQGRQEGKASKLSKEEALEAVARRVRAGERLKDACNALAPDSEVDSRTLYREWQRTR